MGIKIETSTVFLSLNRLNLKKDCLSCCVNINTYLELPDDGEEDLIAE